MSGDHVELKATLHGGSVAEVMKDERRCSTSCGPMLPIRQQWLTSPLIFVVKAISVWSTASIAIM